MAGSGGGEGPLWPGPVQLDKDDARSIRLFLTVKDLKVSSSLLGGNKPKNAELKRDITSSVILLHFEVAMSDGEIRHYEYKKQLPADILPEKTTVKYKKNGLVEVTLWKAKEGSWSPHAKFMTSRNKE